MPHTHTHTHAEIDSLGFLISAHQNNSPWGGGGRRRYRVTDKERMTKMFAHAGRGREGGGGEGEGGVKKRNRESMHRRVKQMRKK
jgi:hypothetical protein